MGIDTSNELEQLLDLHHSRRLSRYRLWAISILILLVSSIFIYRWMMPTDGTGLQYELAEVRQGDLQVTITATGTLEPVNQVDVGSELSGTVDTVEADFNDHVTQGQLLARLNTDMLMAQVIEARATLASKQAKLAEAKATTQETQLAFSRCEKLAKRQLCADEDLDAARAKYLRAQAVQASAQADIEVANATLEGKQTELNKSNIRSPIDGLVLLRQIEPGQTVAASLQAPVLFTLAENLAHMELHIAVDEADVGEIAEGQSATFTVDAYDERSFPATITQVRFAPQTVNGVVTYETVLSVDNTDLSLRPGMTATSVITVQQLSDVLLIPNAALRFSPPVDNTTTSKGRGIFSSLFPRPPESTRRNNEEKSQGTKVWLAHDGMPVAIPVVIGASDGKYTEIKSGELKPGQSVIIDSLAINK